MNIPSSMKIGERVYRVLWVDGFSSTLKVGECNVENCTITLSRTWDGAPASEGLLTRKFWHEVFHAMLYEMGKRNWADCMYVEQMAVCVSAMIDTARFDDAKG